MSHLDAQADEPLRIQASPPSVEAVEGLASAETEAATRPLDYLSAPPERVVAEIARHDIHALEALYDRYGDIVYSVSLRVVGDTQLAEDITQEVFLRLWRRPDLFDESRGRFLTWLLSVARNRAIDELRSRVRRHAHEAQDAAAEALPAKDEGDDPLAQALHLDERVAVRRALALLPPEQRLVIELAYFGGYTQQEIATRLRQPLGTVKTRVRLGLQKLRPLLIGQRDQGH